LSEPLDSGEGISRVTQYAYLCQGAFLSTLTNAKSQTASWSYSDCSLGKPTGYTDTNSAAYTYSYNDSLKRLTGVSEAGGSSTSSFTSVSRPSASVVFRRHLPAGSRT